MKRSFLVGFLGFGCLVTPHLDGQTTEEAAILGLVELSLDVPVKTGAGTLVLTSIVSETIAESPSLPTSYPAGSGITFYFSLDGVKFELSSMSEGYESHTSAWVEDVRVTLVDAQYRDAHVAVRLYRVSESGLGEPRTARAAKHRPVVLEPPLELVVKADLVTNGDPDGASSRSVQVEFREMYLLEGGFSTGQILDEQTFVLDPSKMSWRWRDWEFVVVKSEPDLWMDLSIARLVLEPIPWPIQDFDPYDLPCSYTASNDATNLSANQIDYDWDRYEKCARLDQEGRMRIDPAHVERVSFKDGFARVLVQTKGWYHVRPDGTSLSAISFDFSPDPWTEGLTRGLREGKIVYFNRQFEEAIGHHYDWGWPFENGHALVCEGCELEDSEFEHRALVGGRWWFIDHEGNEVERERLSEEEISRLERLSRHGRLR